ncbi:MAG: peptidase DmpA [Gemmatimonadetes bacterium]|nr:peptidase DmpA [Gemmatimonadota bacterium]
MTAIVDLTPLGIAVGHATDAEGATGLTVIRRHDGPFRAGFAVLGRATGSRDLLAASADHLVGGRVDAIVLTGGSAYGLDAAGGVMQWMEARGRGLAVGPGVVPIVPAAVVFDLTPLGRFDARPTTRMAYDACESAVSLNVAEGSVGAGTGTTVGKILGPSMAMKGGFGCATEHTVDGQLHVAAMVVVNALGDVRDAHGAIIAGARAAGGGFADATRLLRSGDLAQPAKFDDVAMQNTTLAVVAVSAPMHATELTQLARAAGAALFRRITPCGSSFDGDVVFALSPEQGDRARFEPMIVEALAVAALEQAIERAVRLARGRDGIPGLADAHVD